MSAHAGDERPRIKRHFSVVAHGPDVVEFRHGAWNPLSYTVTDEAGGATLLRVVEHLDGARAPAGIARDSGVARADVDALLDHLDGLGVLEYGSGSALDAYLDRVASGLLPYARSGTTAVGPVVVTGDETIAAEIGRILASAGAEPEVDGPTRDLTARLPAGDTEWLLDGLEFERHAAPFAAWRDRLVVHAAASVHPPTLQVLNRLSLRHGFPWLHAAVDGPFLLVGPTCVPARSACFECLEARVLMNLRESASYQRYKRALADGRVAGDANPLDPVLGGLLASHTAFEALNFLLTGTSFTVGKLLAIYLPTFEFTFNEVLRLPGCPACGPAPERDDRELYFELRALLDGHR